MLVVHEPAWHPSPRHTRWSTRAYTPTVYVIGWPDLDVVKVGTTDNRSRWTSFLARGGEVISLTFLTPPDDPWPCRIETWLHQYVSLLFPAAFQHRDEAVSILGNGGCGWTECYRIPRVLWPDLPDGGGR